MIRLILYVKDMTNNSVADEVRTYLETLDGIEKVIHLNPQKRFLEVQYDPELQNSFMIFDAMMRMGFLALPIM